ncbi:uncharacterized protein LOC129779322 isoform X2 [Toxorhynchites rutilus septentrionalis]|nr:uncharacterized protein LOC129779322 isoform X2 [Toxorhynchites rutilus septentrionalis]
MNNQYLQRENDSKNKDVIKPSNIRIWLHQKQMGKLAKVLWAGQGMRLRNETSHHPKMKRFLECVPHVTGVIKDIHQAVVDNDLETLKEKTAPPTPRIVMTSKDANGLTPLHKAAGLAHTQIVEYILSIWPSLSSSEDHTGKTPLHWAASAKNNARSFNLLVQAGSDETALDHRDKTAEYYKNRASEIDRSLLSVIPEAPRISQQGFPAYFDWNMFTIEEDSDDSNGSQMGMKPFLSQNNLLDNDVNSYNSVSKSKSVHNLTNGILTDLPNDESESETKNNSEEEKADLQQEEPKGVETPEPDANGVDVDGNAEEMSEILNVEESKPSEDTEQTESEAAEDGIPSSEAVATNGHSENNPAVVDENGSPNDSSKENASAVTNSDGTEKNNTSTDINEVNNDLATAIRDENEKIEQNENALSSVHNDGEKNEGRIQSNEREDTGNKDDIEQVEEINNAEEVAENGELTNDSLEINHSKPNDDNDDDDGEEIDQDSLNKSDDNLENGSSGNTEQINEISNKLADKQSAKSRQSSSRPPTTTRTSSNQSVIIDQNGNSSKVSSAKSRQLSAKVEETNNHSESQPPASVPQDYINDDKSAEQSDTFTNSATSRKSVKSSANSVSQRSNKTYSATSNYDDRNNNFDDSYELEKANQSISSRPSTAVNEKPPSASTRPQSTATIGNASATSATERGRSTQSLVSRKSPPGNDDGDGDDKSDSNDDSNQADVEIVHYENSDEAGPDDNDKSDKPPDETGDTEEKMSSIGVTNTETVLPANAEMPANGKMEKSDAEFPSPALEIRGTVEGEPDGDQLRSAQISDNLESSNDRPVQEIIDSGDMEQLAVIVLNGGGKKLLGRSSQLPEIQAFLDNVPSYMNKIRRVHIAAREGSLRDLQSALDRRKFATAKDEVSPHGATPLHVATIFGHSGIVRYLAGRFPETTNATDNDGRTPLHYAATLKDNGHFYNLLTHLGANPKVEDNLNHPADFYLNHDKAKDLLSHRQLLQDYGAEEELADEMLNDQVPEVPDLHSARRELDDVDTLTTLERCFKIIHEPVDDVMKSVKLHSNSVPGSASSLRIHITSYLARFLKRSVFDKIKKRQTKLDHNLFDVIWPAMKKATQEKRIDEDLNVGVVIPDYDVFVVFQEFLVPLIKDMHCMDLQQDFIQHPQMQFFPRYSLVDSPEVSSAANGHVLQENYKDVHLNLDTSGKFITAVTIECSRNLDSFEYPLNLSIAQLEKVERILTSSILSINFTRAIGENELGTYYTMDEILENPSEIRTVLATSGLLIPMLDRNDPLQTAESIALNGRYWPYGRGVYVSHNQDFTAWINAQDHLRVICCTSLENPADIGSAYTKVGRAMTFLEDKIQFHHSYLLGYLVSRPSLLGTGLKMTLSLDLPHLCKERENLRHLCAVRGLNLLSDEDQQTVRMSNIRSLGQYEWQIFQDFTGAITNIVALEKELSMSNSLHIAATLLKIFRKKKSSLVEAAPTQ